MMPFSYLATEKPLKLSKILDPSRCIIAERENMPADLSEEDFYTEMKKSNPVLKREEVRIIEKAIADHYLMYLVSYSKLLIR